MIIATSKKSVRAILWVRRWFIYEKKFEFENLFEIKGYQEGPICSSHPVDLPPSTSTSIIIDSEYSHLRQQLTGSASSIETRILNLLETS